METGYIIVFILALFAFIAVAVVKNNGKGNADEKNVKETENYTPEHSDASLSAATGCQTATYVDLQGFLAVPLMPFNGV